jgi:regulator of protease activity HflC (stomatin/prohibitin superfamily)
LARGAERLGLGLTVLELSLVESRPPAEVAADFVKAQGAESDARRRAAEGRAESQRILSEARAAAARAKDAARVEAVKAATAGAAEAERFRALLGVMAEGQGIERTRMMRRMYLEGLSQALGQQPRILVVDPGARMDLGVLGLGP